MITKTTDSRDGRNVKCTEGQRGHAHLGQALFGPNFNTRIGMSEL